MISKLELRRKGLHITTGTLIALFFYFDILTVSLLIIFLILAFALAGAHKKKRIPIIQWFLHRFDRKETMDEFPGKGAILMVFGSLLAVLLFEKSIAVASILILAWADSVAALIGPFGVIRHPKPFSQKKVIEGSLAGTLTGFVAASFFVPLAQAFFASFFAMVVEVLEIEMLNEKIDDNILIPLVAGAVMTLMGSI